MHISHAFIGQVSGVIAFASYAIYIRSILTGRTKPNRATYFIWSSIGTITIASYIAAGATTTIYAGLTYCLLGLTTFFLSIKYGIGGFNKLDVICLIGACAAIVLWIITKNPVTSLYLSIIINLLGWFPTVKKSYLLPQTEDTFAWFLAGISAILNLFALTTFEPKIALFPLYVAVTDCTIAFFLIFPRKHLSASASKSRKS